MRKKREIVFGEGEGGKGGGLEGLDSVGRERGLMHQEERVALIGEGGIDRGGSIDRGGWH